MPYESRLPRSGKFGAAAALCEAPQQYPHREAGCPRCGSEEPACSVDGRTEERADRYRDQNEPPSPARKEAEDRRSQDEEHEARQSRTRTEMKPCIIGTSWAACCVSSVARIALLFGRP